MTKPLILITNDDGIESPGLWAAAQALLDLGELLVVAPDQQWSGAGRAFPRGVTGRITEASRRVDGRTVEAYGVDAAPAGAVAHALLEVADRLPDLLISGINFGENVSTEVSVSGTVGAALEGATSGIPALAVSLAMPIAFHLTGDENADYGPAASFTRRFARALLKHAMPFDVDLLNVNVPRKATAETPWRLTHLSRQRYFKPTPPRREEGEGRLGYELLEDLSTVEPNSDVRAIAVDGVVSVTPLSLDVTSRADFGAVEERLRAGLGRSEG
jgi:5'-nucleotidase